MTTESAMCPMELTIRILRGLDRSVPALDWIEIADCDDFEADSAPMPEMPPPFSDPYAWGGSEMHREKSAALATRGDLLGPPGNSYRVMRWRALVNREYVSRIASCVSRSPIGSAASRAVLAGWCDKTPI
jgi:hypothetical protein